MSYTLYIVESTLCCGLFYTLYKFCFEGKISHRMAARAMIFATLACLAIPFLELPLYPARTEYVMVPVLTAEEPIAPSSITEVADVAPLSTTPPAVAPIVDWTAILCTALWMIYILVVLINLTRLAYNCLKVRAIYRHSDLSLYDAYTLALNNAVKEPFSFWRTIYMSRSIVGEERKQVLTHELSHIKHHHTAERMTMEIVRSIFWFNPFIWLMCNSLTELHEWEADQDVLSEGFNIADYRKIIFNQLFGYNLDIASGLHNHKTKKRFIMMTKTFNGRSSLQRLSTALPLFAAMILAFGATAQNLTPSTVGQAPSPDVVEQQTKPRQYVEIRNSDDFQEAISTFQANYDKGIRSYKTYVRMTNDGVFVINHDASLKRAVGVDMIIEQSNSKDLKKIKSLKGNSMLFLYDLCKWLSKCEGIFVEFEMKSSDYNEDQLKVYCDNLYKMTMAEKPANSSYIFTSFDKRALRMMKELHSESVIKELLPDNDQSTVYISADGKIFFNGREMTLDELKSSLEKMRAEVGASAMLMIKADSSARVGILDDVKYAAREAKVFRVQYNTTPKEILEVLPPINVEAKGINEISDQKIAEHNHLLVFMNASGKIMTGLPNGESGLLEIEELKEIVKLFIDNTERVDGKRQVKNPHYSDFTWQTIKYKDGEVHYPQSNGVISIVTTRGTRCGAYLQMHSAIHSAFYELREELSQQLFEHSFASLDDDEKQLVMRAIPIKVGKQDNTVRK